MQISSTSSSPTVSTAPRPQARPQAPAEESTGAPEADTVGLSSEVLERDESDLYGDSSENVVTLFADAWSEDRAPEQGDVARNDHLEGMLLNQGYELADIYAQDDQGRSLLDRVVEVNKLRSADQVQAGQELVLPSLHELESPPEVTSEPEAPQFAAPTVDPAPQAPAVDSSSAPGTSPTPLSVDDGHERRPAVDTSSAAPAPQAQLSVDSLTSQDRALTAAATDSDARASAQVGEMTDASFSVEATTDSAGDSATAVAQVEEMKDSELEVIAHAPGPGSSATAIAEVQSMDEQSEASAEAVAEQGAAHAAVENSGGPAGAGSAFAVGGIAAGAEVMGTHTAEVGAVTEHGPAMVRTDAEQAATTAVGASAVAEVLGNDSFTQHELTAVGDGIGGGIGHFEDQGERNTSVVNFEGQVFDLDAQADTGRGSFSWENPFRHGTMTGQLPASSAVVGLASGGEIDLSGLRAGQDGANVSVGQAEAGGITLPESFGAAPGARNVLHIPAPLSQSRGDMTGAESEDVTALEVEKLSHNEVIDGRENHDTFGALVDQGETPRVAIEHRGFNTYLDGPTSGDTVYIENYEDICFYERTADGGSRLTTSLGECAPTYQEFLTDHELSSLLAGSLPAAAATSAPASAPAQGPFAGYTPWAAI